MDSTITLTQGRQASIHTITAPESGWRTSSHLIELPSQLILVDTLLVPDHTNEVIGHAAGLDKPITRVYITHGHPDHFAGASLVGVPKYALAPVRKNINEAGELTIKGAYALTGLHDADAADAPFIERSVDVGEAVIDGVRFEFQAVTNAEMTDQLTIGLPEEGIIITGDLVYNAVHAFIAERHFDTWIDAVRQLDGLPYTTALPGHGLPGDRGLYSAMRDYLAVARDAFVQASGPEDLSRRLIGAYPDYGGLAMQTLQNYFLYPPKN